MKSDCDVDVFLSLDASALFLRMKVQSNVEFDSRMRWLAEKMNDAVCEVFGIGLFGICLKSGNESRLTYTASRPLRN
jgi:hypothetical protein